MSYALSQISNDKCLQQLEVKGQECQYQGKSITDLKNCTAVDNISLLGKNTLQKQGYEPSIVMKVFACIVVIECAPLAVIAGAGIFLLMNALLIVGVFAALVTYCKHSLSHSAK